VGRWRERAPAHRPRASPTAAISPVKASRSAQGRRPGTCPGCGRLTVGRSCECPPTKPAAAASWAALCARELGVPIPEVRFYVAPPKVRSGYVSDKSPGVVFVRTAGACRKRGARSLTRSLTWLVLVNVKPAATRPTGARGPGGRHHVRRLSRRRRSGRSTLRSYGVAATGWSQDAGDHCSRADVLLEPDSRSASWRQAAALAAPGVSDLPGGASGHWRRVKALRPELSVSQATPHVHS
jgi:hypothetical protein